MLDSILLMLVLFNPLLMAAFLHDVMNRLNFTSFLSVITRAFLISGTVFAMFAIFGELLFTRVLQVRFSAFLVFGGIVFVVIGIRAIVMGADMIGEIRGEQEEMVGSIAMPFMIGPGTISASVLVGTKLSPLMAVTSIAIALATSCLFLLLTKLAYDFAQKRNERLIERYMEIIGRASALIIGTIAVEMIMKGIDQWQA